MSIHRKNRFTISLRDRRGTERKGTERVPPVPFPERNGTGTQNQGTQRNGNPKLGNVGTRSVPLRSPILNIFLVNFSLKRIQKVKNFAYGVNNNFGYTMARWQPSIQKTHFPIAFSTYFNTEMIFGMGSLRWDGIYFRGSQMGLGSILQFHPHPIFDCEFSTVLLKFE